MLHLGNRGVLVGCSDGLHLTRSSRQGGRPAPEFRHKPRELDGSGLSFLAQAIQLGHSNGELVADSWSPLLIYWWGQSTAEERSAGRIRASEAESMSQALAPRLTENIEGGSDCDHRYESLMGTGYSDCCAAAATWQPAAKEGRNPTSWYRCPIVPSFCAPVTERSHRPLPVTTPTPHSAEPAHLTGSRS